MACGWSTPALGQTGWNVDIDVGGGTPELGNGAPSDAFGAAANQPGRWNRVYWGALDAQLVDLSGASTGARMSVDHFGGPGVGGGNFFAANTGDYALLLNDGLQVAATGPGGRVNYAFSGLAGGDYEVYSYAVHLAGHTVDTPVTVPEAIDLQTQVVTGPMPGNGFALLVTHSRHHVLVAEGGGFHVDITQPANLPHACYVNGFQIVAVPEQSSLNAFALGLLALTVRRLLRGRL